jgi:release factor glutamine methyltransferase
MLSLLSEISTRLAPTSDTAALDASVLLAHILQKPRSWVLAHPEVTLTRKMKDELKDALNQLENGKPFPYVLGQWEFFGMEFEITPDVLIPRPETELLVEKAIAWLKESPEHKVIADVGTGSGVIAISMAANVPHVNVLATDISKEALKIAKRNAERHAVSDKIRFIECDLLPARQNSAPQSLDLICANLPYIPTKTLRTLPVYGREPALALDGGSKGLVLVRRLLQLGPEWLTPHGRMLLEIEATLGSDAMRLAHDLFPRANIRLHKDLSGHDRLLEIALI